MRNFVLFLVCLGCVEYDEPSIQIEASAEVSTPVADLLAQGVSDVGGHIRETGWVPSHMIAINGEVLFVDLRDGDRDDLIYDDEKQAVLDLATKGATIFVLHGAGSIEPFIDYLDEYYNPPVPYPWRQVSTIDTNGELSEISWKRLGVTN